MGKSTYHIDIFGIIVLIVSIVMLMYLILAAIFYHKPMTGNQMSTGEATTFFYMSIIFGVIFLGLAIYAIIHILQHNKEEKIIEGAENITTTTTTKSNLKQKPATTMLPKNEPGLVTSAPPSNLSTTVSAIPGSAKDVNEINELLLFSQQS